MSLHHRMTFQSILKTHVYGEIYEHIHTNARQTGSTSRVTLIQQRIHVWNNTHVNIPTPVFHVGLFVEERGFSKIFEHGPIKYDRYRSVSDDIDSILVPLPPIHQSIRHLEDFEATLPTTYVLGVRDCRHHTLDLLQYVYPCSVGDHNGTESHARLPNINLDQEKSSG